MKKFLVLTCMIACIFGMTACSGEKELTKYEQQKVNMAKSKATDLLIPYIQSILADPEAVELLKEYTPKEVESVVYADVYYNTNTGFEVDGNAFISALDSFAATYDEIGGYGEIKGAEAKIDGKQIVVNVSVEGPAKNATAEIVFSNDSFLELQAASLNQVSTMKDSMVKAALNTVLGMGTVFAVLILISLIISCFGIFSKVQTGTAKADKGAVAAKTVAQPVVQASEELSDDLELVAVIAAAIAASEGAASTDGFVVRSIKRRRAY